MENSNKGQKYKKYKKMLKKYSCESLPLLPNDYPLSSQHLTKISADSVSQNEKYFKTFEQISKIPNPSSKCRLRKLSIIDPTQSSSVKGKLDDLIENLDVVATEARFLSDKVTLLEKIPAKGYIEPCKYQYFDINVKDCISPLRILVKAKRGKAQVFISFKNPWPTKSSFDRVYESDLVEVPGKSSIFSENKCYVSVFALNGASVTITYFFNLDFLDTNTQVRKRKNSITSQKLIKTRPEKDMKYRAQLEARVKIILEKRKALDKLNQTTKTKTNYVELNKTQHKTSPADEISFENKKQTSVKKLEQIKMKKALIQEERSENLKMMMVRKEIRAIAEKKALEIKGIVSRKVFFEKNWLLLNYFCMIFLNWRKDYLLKRREKLYGILSNMQAFKIQKNYKFKFNSGFTLKYRLLAMSNSLLKIMWQHSNHYWKEQYKGQLLDSIKQSANHKNISKMFMNFYSGTIFIQFTWRRYWSKTAERIRVLLDMWSKAVDDIINQMAGGKLRRKKKNLLVEKLMGISFETKVKAIKTHLAECKKDFLRQVSSVKHSKFHYLMNEENMRSLVMKTAKDLARSNTVMSKTSKNK